MKPIIGLTCMHDWAESKHKVNDTYIESVQKAQAIPILLPCVKESKDIFMHLNMISGLIVCGGPDADPRFFGEGPHAELGAVNPAMDAYEIPLLQEALRRDMPILGICRGEQMLNIAAGGTIIQHIPASINNPLKHRQAAPRFYRSHCVEVSDNTIIARLLSPGTLGVNSFHHQAVGTVAPGFVVSAKASDGVVEAIESTQHTFAVGVQWHPECMWDNAENYDDLFAGFIQAAKRYNDK